MNESWLGVCVSCLLNIERLTHAGGTPAGIRSTGEGRFVLNSLYDGDGAELVAFRNMFRFLFLF